MDGNDRKAAAAFGAEGGKARARNLTKAQRTEIARKAAVSRWAGDEGVPVAAYGSADSPLRIGDIEIQCYVLEDGRRVLFQSSLIGALGMSHGGSGSRGGDRLAKFVEQDRLKPFTSQDLVERTVRPIKFRTPAGNIAYGYEATVLADVCEAVLAARKDGRLMKQQAHIADQCEILIRGFARVGIIALVDEATGYQDARARDALARILEAFVAKEFRRWVRTFPIDYYKELCRLRNVKFPSGPSLKLPPYFGHLTNDLVYSRLAPGVLAELRKKNPTVKPGRRRHKHFQWLTDDIGDPRLRQHLWSVITLMRASTSWDQFYAMLDRALPPFSTLPILVAAEQAEN